MSTPNFEIEDKQGRKFWISRSIVVIPFTFKYIDNHLYTLIEKRGKSVSSTGKWCCPCGYLDFDETLEQACIREVREETGVELDPVRIFFINYNSSPDETRQNVGMRYVCFVPPNTDFDMSKIETKDEVDEIKWLKIGHRDRMYRNTISLDYDSIKSVDWAFGHDNLIKDVLTKYYSKVGISVI